MDVQLVFGSGVSTSGWEYAGSRNANMLLVVIDDDKIRDYQEINKAEYAEDLMSMDDKELLRARRGIKAKSYWTYGKL